MTREEVQTQSTYPPKRRMLVAAAAINFSMLKNAMMTKASRVARIVTESASTGFESMNNSDYISYFWSNGANIKPLTRIAFVQSIAERTFKKPACENSNKATKNQGDLEMRLKYKATRRKLFYVWFGRKLPILAVRLALSLTPCCFFMNSLFSFCCETHLVGSALVLDCVALKYDPDKIRVSHDSQRQGKDKPKHDYACLGVSPARCHHP